MVRKRNTVIIAISISIVTVFVTVTVAMLLVNLSADSSPRGRILADVEDKLGSANVLNNDSLVDARNASSSIHSLQYESLFQLKKQEADQLFESSPFKACGDQCESTDWAKLDIASDNIVYPIAGVGTLDNQEQVYCANQKVKDQRFEDGNIYNERDICLDLNSNKVWYTIYIP